MAKTAAADQPVLTLSTKDTRPRISIDGTLYPLRIVMEDIPWLRYFHQAAKYRRCGQLLAKKPRTAAENKELDGLLGPLTECLVDAPVEVLRKLTTDQRWAVVTVFSVLRPKTTTTGAAGQMLAAIVASRESQRTGSGR